MFKYSVKKKIKDLPGNVTVFEAVQKDLDRPVEIRVLNNFVKKESDEYLRFEREFKTIARLDHPNIIKVYDWGIASDKIYYVAEMKPSVGLDEYAKSGKLDLSVSDLFSVGLQIAQAVAYLHKNSIIHRDITFQSINYVENKKSAYISNFSLVKNQNLEDLTAKGVGHFQAGQMLPERILNKSIDHRADVFLFGIFLYELATGKNPLYDESGNPRLLKKDGGNFEKPSTLRSDLSDSGIDDIVMQCIEFEPDSRYQSAQDVIKALEEAQSDSKKGRRKQKSVEAAIPGSAEESADDLSDDDSQSNESDAPPPKVSGKGKKVSLKGASSANMPVKAVGNPDDPFEKVKTVIVSALGNSDIGDTLREMDAKLIVGAIGGSCGFILFFFLFLIFVL